MVLRPRTKNTRRHGAPRGAAARGGRRAVAPDLAAAHRQGRGHVATALSSLSQPLPCRRAKAKALAQSQGHSLCPVRATRRPCRRAVRSARLCLDVDKGMLVAGRMRPHPARPGPCTADSRQPQLAPLQRQTLQERWRCQRGSSSDRNDGSGHRDGDGSSSTGRDSRGGSSSYQ